MDFGREGRRPGREVYATDGLRVATNRDIMGSVILDVCIEARRNWQLLPRLWWLRSRLWHVCCIVGSAAHIAGLHVFSGDHHEGCVWWLETCSVSYGPNI
jgi:hypothetical protein